METNRVLYVNIKVGQSEMSTCENGQMTSDHLL